MIFRFVQSWALVLLIVPFIPYVWHRWLNVQNVSLLYSDVRLFPTQAKSYRVRLAGILPYLRILAWLLLVIALAQPQTGKSVEVVRGSGIDIAIVLDGSSSMDQQIAPAVTRLDSVKDVIADFVMRRHYDRLGLVVFAREAYHQVPLTLDYPAFLTLLDAVQTTQDKNDDGTAIGLGIASAVNMLRKGTSTSKLIILLTDGHHSTGLSPITAAEIAQLFEVRVYVVGVSGDDITHDLSTDVDSLIIRNNINVALMQRVANMTGGTYFQAEDVEGLHAIYEQIDLMEQNEIDRVTFHEWQDQAYGLIGVALLFLAVEFFLRETIFRTLP